jgi:hypothetical protein
MLVMASVLAQWSTLSRMDSCFGDVLSTTTPGARVVWEELKVLLMGGVYDFLGIGVCWGVEVF